MLFLIDFLSYYRNLFPVSDMQDSFPLFSLFWIYHKLRLFSVNKLRKKNGVADNIYQYNETFNRRYETTRPPPIV